MHTAASCGPDGVAVRTRVSSGSDGHYGVCHACSGWDCLGPSAANTMLFACLPSKRRALRGSPCLSWTRGGRGRDGHQGGGRSGLLPASGSMSADRRMTCGKRHYYSTENPHTMSFVMLPLDMGVREPLEIFGKALHNTHMEIWKFDGIRAVRTEVLGVVYETAPRF